MHLSAPLCAFAHVSILSGHLFSHRHLSPSPHPLTHIYYRKFFKMPFRGSDYLIFNTITPCSGFNFMKKGNISCHRTKLYSNAQGRHIAFVSLLEDCIQKALSLQMYGIKTLRWKYQGYWKVSDVPRRDHRCHSQHDIVKTLAKKKADYVICGKGNQKKLHKTRADALLKPLIFRVSDI